MMHSSAENSDLVSRTSNFSSQFLALLVVTIAVGLCSGCWSSFDIESEVKNLNATNAQRLANLYQHFQRQHQGKGPRDKEVFETFISEVNPVLLSRIDVDPNSLEQLFVSERDGQPLVIRYGERGSDRGPSVPIVFEETGVDGKRMIGFTNNLGLEVEDEQEYQAFMDGKTM
jgi:hypothetical protein